MKQGDLFPLFDPPPDGKRVDFRAKVTGEFRPAQPGEWYISGAIPEAYQATGGTKASFNIATLVRGHMEWVEDDPEEKENGVHTS